MTITNNYLRKNLRKSLRYFAIYAFSTFSWCKMNLSLVTKNKEQITNI